MIRSDALYSNDVCKYRLRFYCATNVALKLTHQVSNILWIKPLVSLHILVQDILLQDIRTQEAG